MEEQLFEPIRIEPVTRLAVPFLLLGRERNDARLVGHSKSLLRPSAALHFASAMSVAAAAAVHLADGRPFLDSAVVTRRDLAPRRQGVVQLAQDLLVPAVAVLIEILHRLAREKVVVIEIAQRERLEHVIVSILGVLQVRLAAAMRDQDFPVLMMS